MALRKTDIIRSILAVEIAAELGIQEVGPILKNISIPFSRLTNYSNLENTNEQTMTQDTLSHVGVAFSHHGMIKYTNKYGETHITKSCDAVINELKKSGYIVLDADLIIDRELTETAITQTRIPETRTNIWGEKQTRAKGYGLTPKTLRKIEEYEQGQNLKSSGYVPFNDSKYNLGESTAKDDGILLMAFNHYLVDGTMESISQAGSIEVVEAAIIANALAIKKDFENYAYNIYAKDYETTFEPF